jgi:hypothetical protein
VKLPPGPLGPREPVSWKPWAVVVGGDDNPRDVSKPIAFDEHGRPLYAPRGLIMRIWSR